MTTQKYDPSKHHVIAYDEDGFVIEKAELEEHFADGGFIETIRPVTGTAVPRPQSDWPDEEFYRGPASYYTEDVVAKVDWADYIETAAEALKHIERFEKMAKGLDA